MTRTKAMKKKMNREICRVCLNVLEEVKDDPTIPRIIIFKKDAIVSMTFCPSDFEAKVASLT